MRHIAACGAGIAEDEGAVALVDALKADLEVLQGAVGSIVLAEVGGFAVFGVDAEHGEVAGVAGPHPVVGVAAELADIAWRGAHKTHVGKDLIDIHEILVAIIERLDDGLVVSALDSLGGDCRDILGHDLLAVGFGGLVVDPFEDLSGDILHAHEACDGEPRARDFLVASHGPEAIGQVVVLDGTVAHDVAVAAVVVGEEQPFLADEFTGAAATEEEDGVLEGGVVDVVDILSADVHAGLLHGGLVALEEHRNPHTLVGQGRQ